MLVSCLSSLTFCSSTDRVVLSSSVRPTSWFILCYVNNMWSSFEEIVRMIETFMKEQKKERKGKDSLCTLYLAAQKAGLHYHLLFSFALSEDRCTMCTLGVGLQQKVREEEKVVWSQPTPYSLNCVAVAVVSRYQTIRYSWNVMFPWAALFARHLTAKPAMVLCCVQQQHSLTITTKQDITWVTMSCMIMDLLYKQVAHVFYFLLEIQMKLVTLRKNVVKGALHM